MDRQKILGVALAYMGPTELLVEGALPLHSVDHVDEWVVGLFNLTAANWGQHELVVFKDI